MSTRPDDAELRTILGSLVVRGLIQVKTTPSGEPAYFIDAVKLLTKLSSAQRGADDSHDLTSPTR